MNTTDILIIGAGHAGVECALALRNNGFSGAITLLSAEQELPYERPPLSKALLAGSTDTERIRLRAQSVFDEQRVDLVLGCSIVRLDVANNEALAADGQRWRYRHCVLATGAHARMLPQPTGVDVFAIRTLADVAGLRARLAAGMRLLVVGGGYLGLEAAHTAAKLGAQVTVLEQGAAIMPGRVSLHAAGYFDALHREYGVQLVTDCRIERWSHDEQGWQAQDANGAVHQGDLVLVAVGATPDMALAQDAGIACANGILVDQECRTSAAGVFAIGDCAAALRPECGGHVRVESVNNALVQAKLVAALLTGKPVAAARPPSFWSEQCGKRLQMAGLLLPHSEILDKVVSTARGWVVERYQDGVLRVVEAVDSPVEFMQAVKRIGADANP